MHRKRYVVKSLFNKVSGLQPAVLSKKRLRNRFFHTKLLRTRYFIEHLGQLPLEEHRILLKTVPMAILNDISKAYYQKRFVVCFLRSTYGGFMEFLIETYKQRFFLFLNFSSSLPNGQLHFSSCKRTFFQILLAKTSSYVNEQKNLIRIISKLSRISIHTIIRFAVLLI